MKIRILVIVASVLMLTWLGASLFRSRQAALQPQTDDRDSVSLHDPHTPDPRRARARKPSGEPSTSELTGTVTNHWLQSLLSEGGEVPLLPPEQVERWLELNHTNADSLLAARQSGAGREYLLTALTNYPNDSRVLFTALSLDDSPEAKHERLERFKTAAPENALVDYLSAREHLKNSQSDQAMRDLLTASQKGQFQDYTLEATQNAEELYLAAGKSPAEAKAFASSTVLLPHLAQLKGLAQDMATLQRQYVGAGDSSSAETLAHYGLQLSEHLSTGEGSRYLIDQLVGYAVERIVLSPLNAEKNYDFLQGTVQDRLAQLDAKKAEAKQTSQFLSQWMATASEADLVNYFERLKVYGENGALNWLRQR